MAKRARKAAREPLKDLPTFALAPPNTPAWLRTRDAGEDVPSAFDLVGMDASVEPDDWEGYSLGWKWEDFVWGYSAYSEHPTLVFKYYSELMRGEVRLDALDEQSRLLALREIQIRHKGDPVWWTDLDSGPVEPVTLYDLVVFEQPRIVDNKPLWMMSLSQFDNAEWPAESAGGPPFTPHVSVARAAEDHFNDPWPPNEHGVIHTLVEMPKGPPRWLEAGSAAIFTASWPIREQAAQGVVLVPVRIDTNQWEEILRVDGYAAARQLLTGDTPETAVTRSAKWFLEVLTGGRRKEGDGSMSPNSVYIDAARYFTPRSRFVRYGKGAQKYGIWAGGGLFKKESIREILSAVIVTHEGSTVWLYDLEAGKADRVLTLWEMIHDWFVDVDGKRIGSRQNTGAFGPLPVYFLDVREPGTVRSRAPEKKLWPMSERMWESGEWPSEDLGGPPAAKYGMEAAESAARDMLPTPDNEFPHGEPFVVYAPKNTPEWLIAGRVDPHALPVIETWDGVEVVTTDEQPPKWPMSRQRDGSWGATIRWSNFVARLRDDLSTAQWRYDMRTLAWLDAKISRIGLAALEVRHYGIPVWWVDLDQGPQRAATLFDLVIRKQPWKVKGRPLWLMSLQQWDNAEWPAESQGGPPYTPHVSVARERKNPTAADAGEMVRTQIIAPRYTPTWLISATGKRKLPRRRGKRTDDVGPVHWLTVERPPYNSSLWPEAGFGELDDLESVKDNAGTLMDQLTDPKVAPDIYSGKDDFWVRWERGERNDMAREALALLTPIYNDSPIWWFDHGTPERPATVLDFYKFPPGSDLGKKNGRHYYAMSYADWESGNWPDEIAKIAKGAWEDAANPIAYASEAELASDAALICMGRNVILELDDCDDIQLPARWGMLHDPSGDFWPSCSLLFCKFTQGDESDSSDEAVGYFGKRADIRRGRAKMPLPSLHDGWHEVGVVSQVFYERAGVNAGRYKHKFNDPRGWMWLVALFKRRVAKTPPILFEYDDGKLQALRLELPDGCVVDDRGIALP